MFFFCNNKRIEIEAGATLMSFIEKEELNPDTVVVQCNSVIIPRDNYATHVLTSGCTLELIRFVGGG